MLPIISDTVCRTIAAENINNPDPNQKCDFSEDLNSHYSRCSKKKDNDYYWCPTKGWKQDKLLKMGICNNACSKESGKIVKH